MDIKFEETLNGFIIIDLRKKHSVRSGKHQIDKESESRNRENIQEISDALNCTFQKIGMVKYDAFHEMGGKLSFSLALLDRKNDGFIINAMHSREGCYTYIKEILDGNSIIVLADEEKEALDIAMGTKEEKIEKTE